MTSSEGQQTDPAPAADETKKESILNKKIGEGSGLGMLGRLLFLGLIIGIVKFGINAVRDHRQVDPAATLTVEQEREKLKEMKEQQNKIDSYMEKMFPKKGKRSESNQSTPGK